MEPGKTPDLSGGMQLFRKIPIRMKRHEEVDPTSPTTVSRNSGRSETGVEQEEA